MGGHQRGLHPDGLLVSSPHTIHSQRGLPQGLLAPFIICLVLTHATA